MRSITKQGNGGFHLNQKHGSPPQTHDNATSRWSAFGHKDTVLRYLLEEQFHLCCYSEFRPDQEGLGYHIEHVENKSQNPLRTFDYRNLAASALDSATGLKALKKQNSSDPEVIFGGHASGKQTGCDMTQFISCHQPDCARYFAYLPTDGRVIPREDLTDPADKVKAQYTIDLLNLNSPFLIARRRAWAKELQDLLDEHAANQWSLEHLIQVDLLPTNGKLNRFFSLTRQFYGPLAEKVLTQNAPALV